MTQKTTINMSDFGWLLNRAFRSAGPADQQRFARLENDYRRAALALGVQTEENRQTARFAPVARYIEFTNSPDPTHFVVVISNSYAEPVTVTSDKAVAIEAARIFNLAQSLHPDGQALTAEVYGYGPGSTKGTLITS
jgi:hypothetical protein